jgi:hypothetical protein
VWGLRPASVLPSAFVWVCFFWGNPVRRLSPCVCAVDRVRQLKETPYSQAEAEAAAGLGTYVKPQPVELPDVAVGLGSAPLLQQPPAVAQDAKDTPMPPPA